MTSPDGIGAARVRLEDPRFLTGRGRYVDDIAPVGLAYARVVRSPHAHARIIAIDTAEALACPGVLAILTDADVQAAGLGDLPCGAFPNLPPGARFHRPLQPILARGKARYVGEAVAIVVATTPALALDAAERVSVTWEPLPPVLLGSPGAAKAPPVWDGAPDNVAFTLERGDREAVGRAFAAAHHVATVDVHFPRATACSIEPRVVLAIPDPAGDGCTLCSSTQSPFQVREVVAEALGMEEAALRVVAPDVGGAFGMKAQIYPEEVLVTWAARLLGRPVKWTSDRSEALAADQQGRHQIAKARLALDRSGRALALDVDVAIDLGAYLAHHAGVAPNNAAISYTNAYDIPLIRTTVRACFTNTTPIGPYRGTAKPEATYVTERLIERAARATGQDPIALRRLNFIPPERMPYRTPGGYVFDACEFAAVLDGALALADRPGFAARRAASERAGRLRGFGLAMHCQRAGSQSERMEIRVARDGSVALHVGTLATGQGHETVFPQMIADWLGVPIERVRIHQGDTTQVLYGRGTYSQRSMNAGGSALRLAADAVIAKGRRVAAFMLEASEADVTFVDGAFAVEGTDRRVSFAAVAAESVRSPGLPPELGIGLDGVGTHPGPNTFPNGCMACEVEIDPETGVVTVAQIVAVDDVGVALNPLLLEGQLHGSIAQGLGPVLFEAVHHDPATGQLLTGTFLDYALPRADDMPPVRAALHCVPTATNPLGVKGGSEAGNVGMPPAIVHAILDALASRGIDDVPMPATPERVWRLIRAAGPAVNPPKA